MDGEKEWDGSEDGLLMLVRDKDTELKAMHGPIGNF